LYIAKNIGPLNLLFVMTSGLQKMPDHAELEFFDTISGRLEIELDVPAEPVADLLNLQASPDARVVKMSLVAEIFDEVAGEFRSITEEELNRVAFRGANLKLSGESEVTVSHAAPNGEYFTVRELLRVIEETEQQTRYQSEWLGGVDVHHCFFEGICNEEGDVRSIYWGS